MQSEKRTHIRYVILLMLFVASTFSYGDRVVLSISGVLVSKDMGLNAVQLGYLFSGFSWAYVAGQLPAGGVLDRFGSRIIYGISIIAWSVCGLLSGFTGFLPATIAYGALLALRLISGLAQSPVFPGNGRIVAEWFPAKERGVASAFFNSSQYFALVLFAPLMAWVAHRSSWRDCFLLLGVGGLVLAYLWFHLVHRVREHPFVSWSEIEYIERGGGLVNVDGVANIASNNRQPLSAIATLLRNRMLIGIYIGQYCITTLTWFFLTWFPVYLLQARHMSLTKAGFAAALPALCGCIGGILGGVISDHLLREGYSLTLARKVPIVAGMAMATAILGCNYANSQQIVVLLMSVAFFGKGIGALGWTVISDTSPVGLVGLNGGLFNLIGNMAGITTPIAIGYIVQSTGSFHGALLYVAGAAVLAIVSYTFIVGNIERLQLEPQLQTRPVGGPAQ